MSDQKIKILVSKQGDAVAGKEGYGVVRGENVIAFYVDGWGESGRIYPAYSSSSSVSGDAPMNCPSIGLSSDDETDPNETLTEICFPDFGGWDIHSLGGGKTMAVCLTRKL